MRRAGMRRATKQSITTLAIFVFCASLFLAQTTMTAKAPSDVSRRATQSPQTEARVKDLQSLEQDGDLHMLHKNYREAIDTYAEITRVSPNNAVVWNKQGIAHHQLLEFKLARQCYKRAIKINRKYSEAINNLGTIYYAVKNYGRAIRYYQQALEIAPASASIYSNMGTALFSRKKYPEAMTAYRKALELDPEVFEHKNAYGVLLQERTIQDRAMFDYI